MTLYQSNQSIEARALLPLGVRQDRHLFPVLTMWAALLGLAGPRLDEARPVLDVHQ